MGCSKTLQIGLAGKVLGFMWSLMMPESGIVKVLWVGRRDSDATSMSL